MFFLQCYWKYNFNLCIRFFSTDISPLSNERLMYMLLNKVYTKIKKLFNTKIVIEPKKEIEFKSKIPEYTKWVIPINFMK